MKRKSFVVSLLALFLIASSMSLHVKAEYRYGGSLKVALQGSPSTLNQFIDFTGLTLSVTHLIYEPLVTNSPEWKIVPWLAHSWEISEDGKTYTFHLVENATYTDGVPLTSEDVKFTIEYIKEYQLPQCIVNVKNIASVTTPDKYTVVINLNTTQSTFLAADLYHIPIVPKHIWEKVEDPLTYNNEECIGSGPYILEKWEPGQYVTLKANENYWRGRPYLDEVKLITIMTRDVQIMAFTKGEIDLVSLHGNEVSGFLGPEYRIYTTIDPGLQSVGINMRRAPGNDINLRRALSYCIDRERIINVLNFGYGTINTHYITEPYAPGGWLTPEGITAEYNLTKAATILEEAGYVDIDGDGWRDFPNGTSMTLDWATWDQPTAPLVRTSEVIVEDLKSIGLNIKLEVQDIGLYVTTILTTHDYDFCYHRFGPGSGDPSQMLSWFLTVNAAPGRNNWCGFSNSTFDELFEEQVAIVDEAERRDIIWRMQRVLMEQLPGIPTVHSQYLTCCDVDEFEGWVNASPYGPDRNAEIWTFIELHLKGAPPPTATQVTIDLQEDVLVGEEVSISATMKDEDGIPIEGEYIDFYAGNLAIASTRTDSDGVAEYIYVPTRAGEIDFKSVYGGSAEYAGSKSLVRTMTISSPATPTPSPTKPDYTPYYLSAFAVLIVIVVAAIMVSRARRT